MKLTARPPRMRSRHRMRRVSLVLVGVLGASSFFAGCAHGPGIVTPDPCERATEEQLEDLKAMVTWGDYPGVEEIVSAYEHHCCVDDRMSGRANDACEEDNPWWKFW